MLHPEARNRRILLRLALICLALIVHGKVAAHDFVDMDDPAFIYGNPRLKPPSIKNTIYYWTHPAEQLYIPCTYTAWSMTAVVSGMWHGSDYVLRPIGFHLASLGCHLLCVLLIFEILQMLHNSPESAAIGAALFAIHPLQVEAVAWASELKDLLCGLAALAAVWLYLAAISLRHRAGGQSRSAATAYTLAVLAFAIALLAKPAGVAAVGVAAILDRYLFGTRFRGIALRLSPWILIGLVLAIIAHRVQPAGEVADNPLILRPLIALDALSFYLWKLCWPLWLSPNYGRRPTMVINQGYIAWTWTIPLAVGLVLWSIRRRSRLPIAGAAVSIAGLLPVLGFVPFIYQTQSTVADHYVYLAMLGPAMVLACCVHRYRPARIPAMIVLSALAICSIGQESVWTNSLRLFAHAVEVSPSAPFNHLNYGVALASNGQFDEATLEFRQTLALSPQNSQARDNLALLRKIMDNRPKAP
jgi:tetratricopeptide (TPR) repeat protein